MRYALKRLLPHGVILISNMYIVFFAIDRVNTAMNFIDNGLTKGLLWALCALSAYVVIALNRETRRRRRRAPSASHKRRERAPSGARKASSARHR